MHVVRPAAIAGVAVAVGLLTDNFTSTRLTNQALRYGVDVGVAILAAGIVAAVWK